jgi:hypothetical protein
MRHFWKWILGILVAALALAILAGLGFWIFTHWTGGSWMMGARAFAPGDPSWEDLPRWGDRMPMHPYQRMPHSMLPFSRYGGFLPFSYILGGLFRLGLLALFVVGVVLVVQALQRPRTGAAAGPLPASPTAIGAAVSCPNCGAEVQAGWKYCPNCGGAQTT